MKTSDLIWLCLAGLVAGGTVVLAERLDGEPTEIAGTKMDLSEPPGPGLYFATVTTPSWLSMDTEAAGNFTVPGDLLVEGDLVVGGVLTVKGETICEGSR